MKKLINIKKMKPLVWETTHYNNREYLITKKQQNLVFEIRLPEPNQEEFEFLIVYGSSILWSSWLFNTTPEEFTNFIDKHYIEIIKTCFLNEWLTDFISNNEADTKFRKFMDRYYNEAQK
jgi:hypothetical protein